MSAMKVPVERAAEVTPCGWFRLIWAGADSPTSRVSIEFCDEASLEEVARNIEVFLQARYGPDLEVIVRRKGGV